MKRVYTLLLALCPVLLVFGQKEAPPFGQIDKADLEMTTCDIDPEANAYTLVKTGEIDFTYSGLPIRETIVRYRVKILSDRAVSRGNIRMVYESKDDVQFITDIKGLTYNLDDNGNVLTSKLDKKNVFSKQLDQRLSEVDFSLPDVKKGSVIEYTYTISTKTIAVLDNWDLQEDNPIRFSQLYLSIPRYVDFSYNIHRTLPLDVHDDPSGAKVFTMENIPSLQDEPFMSSRKDYLQHLEFKLTAVHFPGQFERDFNTSWEKINDDMVHRDDLGAKLDKTLPHTEELDGLLAAVKPTDSVARMALVYDYVRQHMEHDENGNSRFAPDGVKTAWENKKGGIGAINLVLVSLLRHAGLRAYPLLVSTRKHGGINTISPSMSQFNQTLALVKIGQQGYVLNGIDKFTPYTLVPYDVQNSSGFIIDRDAWGWIELYDGQDRYQTTVVLTGQMNAGGVLKGHASIYNSGYAKVPRERTLKESGPERFKELYYTRAYRNFRADSLALTGENDDTLPLTQELDFHTRLNNTGDYTFFTPSLFLGLERNPFIADQRFSDVDFGYAQRYSITGSLQLPDGFAFDTLPKNIRMVMPDTSIVLERLMQVDEGVLSYRINLEIKRPVYMAAEYPDFHEFYKKLFATLNDPVVIQKKNP